MFGPSTTKEKASAQIEKPLALKWELENLGFEVFILSLTGTLGKS